MLKLNVHFTEGIFIVYIVYGNSGYLSRKKPPVPKLKRIPYSKIIKYHFEWSVSGQTETKIKLSGGETWRYKELDNTPTCSHLLT